MRPIHMAFTDFTTRLEQLDYFYPLNKPVIRLFWHVQALRQVLDTALFNKLLPTFADSMARILEPTRSQRNGHLRQQLLTILSETDAAFEEIDDKYLISPNTMASVVERLDHVKLDKALLRLKKMQTPVSHIAEIFIVAGIENKRLLQQLDKTIFSRKAPYSEFLKRPNALFFASAAGNSALCRYLLDKRLHHAPLDMSDREILIHMMSHQGEYPEKYVGGKRIGTPLSYAAMSGNIECYQMMSAVFNDQYAVWDLPNQLLLAAWSDNANLILEMLQAGKILPGDKFDRDFNGMDLVHYAASSGHMAVLQFLLNKGFALAKKDKHGRTVHSYTDSPQLARWFIAQGIYPSPKDVTCLDVEDVEALIQSQQASARPSAIDVNRAMRKLLEPIISTMRYTSGARDKSLVKDAFMKMYLSLDCLSPRAVSQYISDELSTADVPKPRIVIEALNQLWVSTIAHLNQGKDVKVYPQSLPFHQAYLMQLKKDYHRLLWDTRFNRQKGIQAHINAYYEEVFQYLESVKASDEDRLKLYQQVKEDQVEVLKYSSEENHHDKAKKAHQSQLNGLIRRFHDQKAGKDEDIRQSLLTVLSTYLDKRKGDAREYYTFLGHINLPFYKNYSRKQKVDAVEALIDSVMNPKAEVSWHTALDVIQDGSLGRALAKWMSEQGVHDLFHFVHGRNIEQADELQLMS